eukprot:gene3245-3759_t
MCGGDGQGREPLWPAGAGPHAPARGFCGAAPTPGAVLGPASTLRTCQRLHGGTCARALPSHPRPPGTCLPQHLLLQGTPSTPQNPPAVPNIYVVLTVDLQEYSGVVITTVARMLARVPEGERREAILHKCKTAVYQAVSAFAAEETLATVPGAPPPDMRCPATGCAPLWDMFAAAGLAQAMARVLAQPRAAPELHHMMLLWFWNFSTDSYKSKEALATVHGVLSLSSHAKVIAHVASKPEFDTRTLKSARHTPRRCAVCILNSLCQGPCREALLEAPLDDTLVFLMQDESCPGRGVAAVGLSYLIGTHEDTLSRLAASASVISELVHTFENDGWTPEKTKFPLETLGIGLRNLATADSNKEAFGAHIEVLSRLAVRRSHFEVRALILEILWQLAFHPGNRDKMRQLGINKGLPATGSAVDSDRAQHVHSGLMWMIQLPAQKRWALVRRKLVTLSVLKKFRTRGGGQLMGSPHEAPLEQQVAQEHIMISYNWGTHDPVTDTFDNQELIKALARRMQADGFRVWLDVDQMAGSTMDAMAEAVEGSALVLICMSQKYKDSPNCRSEAVYTSQLRKPFIPLMMQDNWGPNGWLGFMLGAKLWYRLSHEKMNSNYPEIIKAVRKAIGAGASSTAPVAAPMSPHGSSPASAPRGSPHPSPGPFPPTPLPSAPRATAGAMSVPATASFASPVAHASPVEPWPTTPIAHQPDTSPGSGTPQPHYPSYIAPKSTGSPSSNQDNARSWSTDRVCKWLDDIGLGHVQQYWVDEGADG